MSSAGPRDRGSGTVLMVFVVAAVLALTLAALVIGSAVAASHRARLAADLAALAGARHVQSGATVAAACGEAARVAGLNGAALRSCAVDGDDLTLVVAVPANPTGEAVARSRAGPAR